MSNIPGPASGPKDWDYLFKLLIIGDSGVGKSSLLLRLSDNTFSQKYITTIGMDFNIRTIDMDGMRIKLQIWDTAGQERFRTITSTYYRGTHGVIVVYDVTNGETFSNVKRWLSEINANCDSVQRILVGNKCEDKENRVVLEEDARRLATAIKVDYYETSAKDNLNVQEMINAITRQVLDFMRSTGNPSERNDKNAGQSGIKLNSQQQKSHQNKKCC